VPLVWLVIAIALAVAEVFTTTFVLAMFAAGALVAALVAALGVNIVGQTLIFAIVSTLALVVVRPVVRRHLHRGDHTEVGLAAIEGSVATVLEEVDAEHGLVKIEGEMWRARPVDAQQVIPVGAQVRVVAVHGATALVWRE
jgi:membrane protein implicated in regulation of membrane protease activity